MSQNQAFVFILQNKEAGFSRHVVSLDQNKWGRLWMKKQQFTELLCMHIILKINYLKAGNLVFAHFLKKATGGEKLSFYHPNLFLEVKICRHKWKWSILYGKKWKQISIILDVDFLSVAMLSLQVSKVAAISVLSPVDHCGQNTIVQW